MSMCVLDEIEAIDVTKNAEIVLTILQNYMMLLPKDPSFCPTNFLQTERLFC